MSPLDNLQTGAGAAAGSFEISSSCAAALCPLFPRGSGVLVAGGHGWEFQTPAAWSVTARVTTTLLNLYLIYNKISPSCTVTHKHTLDNTEVYFTLVELAKFVQNICCCCIAPAPG